MLGIPLPYNPPGATNIYLLRSNDGYLLIDTGWNSDQAFNALAEGLNDIGADFKDIKKIIMTHAHPDHYGLVGKVRELSKAKIYIHHKDEEIFQRYAAVMYLLPAFPPEPLFQFSNQTFFFMTVRLSRPVPST
jgi:glyoxylase-like metal-dependent hydrolase (beta-lactamase superfamily II)